MKRFLAALVLLLVASQANAAESRNNIVILLDTSGSMSEQMRTVRQSKWDAAKSALINVVDQIPENTNIGLLLFNPEDWRYDLGPVNKADLTRAIQSAQITDRSGTPLGTYMKKGVDRLLQEREKSFGYGTYKLLIVTDGDPTNEPSGLVDKFLPDILARGITVECIGVSMASHSVLKDKVHKYMSADDPTSLTQQIQSTVLAEVSLEDGVGGFEELSGIPTPTAEAIISTLSTSGNHPIGENPPKVIVDQETGQTQVVPGGPINPTQADSGMGIIGVVLIVVVVVVLAFLFCGCVLSGNRY